MDLKDKNIVLGVSGGIAAYKSVELLRMLVKQGAVVRVIMTRSACKFVGPLTFKALSGNPVCVSLFDDDDDAGIRHIDWAREADAVIVAPATANIIGKMACGLADDALSTFMLAVTAPRLICPAMNTHMYENRAVQRNIDTLEENGFTVIEPGSGELACGTTGPGRMPDPEIIVDRFLHMMAPKDFAGKRVLVTAGPTREPVDPVRFISNSSSGKMGYAIARAAEYRGATVALVSGPVSLRPPVNVDVVSVETAGEMATAVLERMAETDIIFKVAAVGDYRTVDAAEHKIKKKDGEGMVLKLTENMDILRTIGQQKTGQVVVGFAAETQDLADNAQKKLAAKNTDMIAANLISATDSPFNADANKVHLFYKNGREEDLPKMGKPELANALLDRVLGLMDKEEAQA
ncbi:MAG: bifunctional phosphopantothenoylcysteine decarboxylase/phosphopantothenate--cysteine ligase CoaBC [Thermodesulfobacteriota bacterium]|nr:bifunctional phosphopantothenoylcysteine decarboxylase/phosphopantothenate--cysteine ligase CoaBC [Thermodesulfobacteriota bacterium]